VGVPQQTCHLFARLTLADAAIVLNPEARSLCNDLVVRRKSNAVADLVGLVSASNQDASMHDCDDAEKWCIYRDQSAGSIREYLELFQGDFEHRPEHKTNDLLRKRIICSPRFSHWHPQWHLKCSNGRRRSYDLSRMQK
jgi:hypothetical protein